MSTNSQIYLIGLAVLFFLIVTFFFIRKISNNGKLKVKIEEPAESLNSEILADIKNQQSFDFNMFALIFSVYLVPYIIYMKD